MSITSIDILKGYPYLYKKKNVFIAKKCLACPNITFLESDPFWKPLSHEVERASRSDHVQTGFSSTPLLHSLE